MEISLRTLLLLLLAVMPSLASALVLGEGRILSHVGELFSASIALPAGDYQDVRFFQVKNAECRSSVIAESVNGCDSLYEGPLNFSIRKNADGHSYLSVTGEKKDELYYRIVIKSVSPVEGTVYNAFEFLPEFSASSEVQSPRVAENPVTPVARHAVSGESVIAAHDVQADVAKHDVRSNRNQSGISSSPDALNKVHRMRPLESKPQKRIETRLEIKKYGEYSDDIHALQKENGEIEEQIALLEKHISLLKEVIRLKSQIGASMVPESSVVAPAQVPIRAPLQPAKVQDQSGMLSWILLSVILVLALLIGWMYRKQQSKYAEGDGQAMLTPPLINEMKPLDLTNSFVKSRW
jgi:hypothetical protein